VNPTDRLRSLLSQGALAMRRWENSDGQGRPPIGCIKAIHEAESVGLAEAKRLFSESVSWADVLRSHDQFAEELEALIGDRTEAVTIYVALRDEGVPVWRPVAAAKVDVDAYRILSATASIRTKCGSSIKAISCVVRTGCSLARTLRLPSRGFRARPANSRCSRRAAPMLCQHSTRSGPSC